jgi:hypothetical protein
MKFIVEPSKQVPVLKEVDVAVVGGGPAGLIAATAASQMECSVLLIEREGHLGGYFDDSGPGSAQLGFAFQDTDGNRIINGIPWKIMERLIERGGALPPMKRRVTSKFPYSNPAARTKAKLDYEVLKTLAFELVKQNNISLLLHTWVVGVVKENNSLTGVITESKSGRQAILAKVIVDATGDADVVAFGGGRFQKADAKKLCQISRAIQIAGIDTKSLLTYIEANKPSFTTIIKAETEKYNLPTSFEKKQIMAEFPGQGDIQVSEQGGVLHIKASPGWHADEVGVGLQKGITRIKAGTEGDGTNVLDLTRAEIEIREKLLEKVEKLRKTLPGYENCFIIPSSLPLGVRETRRIIGEYVLKGSDVMAGKRFPDTIARSANSIDLHLPKGKWEYGGVKGYHDIPYRSLLPLDVEGIAVAGRCISCDRKAFGAIRQVPVCMATGQAAGTAAAIAAKTNTTPRKIPLNKLQEQLRKEGMI